jgi:hypothetical protein
MNAELLYQLGNALRSRDLALWETCADEVESLGAQALARRDRKAMRALATQLSEWALAAEAFAGEQFPIGRFRHRWAALARGLELVLVFDRAGAAAEDVGLLDKFAHALPILRHVGSKQVSSLADIFALRRWREKAACWNCVDRLVRKDLLIRVPRGLYRLSPRGEAVLSQVAKQMEETIAAGAVAEAAPYPEVGESWFAESSTRETPVATDAEAGAFAAHVSRAADLEMSSPAGVWPAVSAASVSSAAAGAAERSIVGPGHKGGLRRSHPFKFIPESRLYPKKRETFHAAAQAARNGP